MAIGLVKGESSVFLKEETTEGTYVAPASANDAVEVLEDGLEFNYNRDEIQRNNLTSTIEAVASRVGLKQVAGSIPVEYKSAALAGAAPREAVLYKSLLGGVKSSASSTTKTGNTSTVLQIQDADISKYAVNDIVLVKEAGNFEMRPISAVSTTIGAATITLKFPLDGGAPADNVVIEAFTKYYHLKGAPTFSATHYIGGEIEERVTGLRAVSANLESWETAQLASWNFAVEGLDLDRSVTAPSFTPDFASDALPPVLIEACVWINGVEVNYNALSLNLENTKAEILSACSESGKIASRFTEFVASGEINPYMEDDDVARFDSFNNNDDVHIFGYAFNPTSTAGEGQNYVAFWFPQAKVTQIPAGDEDGIMTDNISFKAYRKLGNDSVFLAFV